MPVSYASIIPTIQSYKTNREALDIKQIQESQAYLQQATQGKTQEVIEKLKQMLGESIIEDFGMTPVPSNYKDGLAHIVEVGLTFEVDNASFYLEYHKSGYHSHVDANPINNEFPKIEGDHFVLLVEPTNHPPALDAAIEAAISTTTPPPSPKMVGAIGVPFQAFVPSLNAYATYDQNPDNPTVGEIFYLAIERGMNAVNEMLTQYAS